MKFEELTQAASRSDGDCDKPNYFLKIREMKKKNKELREQFKSAKLSLYQSSEIFETASSYNHFMKEELSFTKLENSRLSENLQDLKIKANKSKSRASSKKLLKKNRIFAIAPAKTAFEKEYSLICSPVFNHSYQIFSQDTKRNPSLEITQGHIVTRGVKLRKL
jgi:predicted nuclease with TOPRIM domain